MGDENLERDIRCGLHKKILTMFDRLPTDICHLILEYLDYHSKNRLSRVSKCYRGLLSVRSFVIPYKYICSIDPSVPRYLTIKDIPMNGFLPRFENLISLNLHNTKRLFNFNNICPNITHLTVKFKYPVGLLYCPDKLEELSLFHYDKNHVVNIYAKNLVKLESNGKVILPSKNSLKHLKCRDVNHWIFDHSNIETCRISNGYKLSLNLNISSIGTILDNVYDNICCEKYLNLDIRLVNEVSDLRRFANCKKFNVIFVNNYIRHIIFPDNAEIIKICNKSKINNYLLDLCIGDNVEVLKLSTNIILNSLSGNVEKIKNLYMRYGGFIPGNCEKLTLEFFDVMGVVEIGENVKYLTCSGVCDELSVLGRPYMMNMSNFQGTFNIPSSVKRLYLRDVSGLDDLWKLRNLEVLHVEKFDSDENIWLCDMLRVLVVRNLEVGRVRIGRMLDKIYIMDGRYGKINLEVVWDGEDGEDGDCKRRDIIVYRSDSVGSKIIGCGVNVKVSEY